MSSKKVRHFECSLVSEDVKIFLRKRQRGMYDSYLLVQCDQLDCQYVDKNVLPCPLTLDMFSEEILAQKERARQRLEDRAN